MLIIFFYVLFDKEDNEKMNENVKSTLLDFLNGISKEIS